MENITVLMVDDNPINLQILLGYLEESGFKTLVATNGEQALRRAKRTQPELILLDIMMPGMDGFTICKRLKEDEITKDIPVIFMTALSNIENKVKGFEAGAVDYVTKPFQKEDVLARVNIHITIRNLQKGLQDEIEEHKKTAEKLQTSNIKLKGQNEELDAFSHTVAHNLRNPLGLILGYADLLNEEVRLSDELQERLNAIIRSGRKMDNIIEELLLLAGVRNLKVEMESLSMARIVAEAKQRLDYIIEEYQAKIIFPTYWPTAIGYAPWVEEVWVNYMSNGIKYGGQMPHLQLGATASSNGYIRFWVRDNGDGLNQEEQDKLFTPFTKLHHASIEGHGLGLSIVQRIIEKLGGQVAVESESMPGQGSIFSFTLPAAD